MKLAFKHSIIQIIGYEPIPPAKMIGYQQKWQVLLSVSTFNYDIPEVLMKHKFAVQPEKLYKKWIMPCVDHIILFSYAVSTMEPLVIHDVRSDIRKNNNSTSL